MSEYQKVVYFCLSFCRSFDKLLGDIDDEGMEDMFDLLIVTSLTADEQGETKPQKGYIDQVDL